MNFIKKNWVTLTVIMLCIILEIVISNYTSMGLFFKGAQEIAFDIKEGEAVSAQEDIKETDDGFLLMNGKLVFDNVSEKMHNICVTLNGDGEYVSLYFQFTDDNFSSDNNLFGHNSFKELAYAGENEKNCFNVSSYGEVKQLQIFLDKSTYIPITSIVINYYPPFHFNFVRMLLFLIVGLIVTTGLWKTAFDSKKHSKYIAVTAALVCLVIVGLTLIIALKSETVSLYDDNPNESDEQYGQLFEAFLNGRLNLDIDYDTSELDKLNNPYDISEREINGSSVPETWDRAYYNGQFFCYFGAAPVFTVYFPFYMIFRHAPSALFASAMLCVYSVIFISLLYNLIVKKMCRDTPLLPVIIGHISLLSTSMIFALMTESKFYYMAALSGIGALAAFLYFLLSAYYSDRFRNRVILLVLAGISVVMIAASRPSLLIYALVAIVPAAFVLADKNENLKHKICYIAGIGAPIIAGGIVLMLYNYARFDNPFEFGFNYQLTVSIADANNLTLAMIPATVYHYFIQHPQQTSMFPYLRLASDTLVSYPRYTYVAQCVGVLNYPLIWGAFLVPSSLNKKNKFRSCFLTALTISALLLAFIDMCKAGAHYRYTADILLPLGIAAVIAAFNILLQLKESNSKYFKAFYFALIVCLLISAVIGFLMMFANEYLKMFDLYPSVTRAIQNIFA